MSGAVALLNLGRVSLEWLAERFEDVRISKIIGSDVTAVYATMDGWQQHHATLLGVLRKGVGVEPVIFVEAYSPEIAMTSVGVRVRVWRRGDTILAYGVGSVAGILVVEAGFVRVTPLAAILVASAPWKNMPPSSFPSPAFLLQKLLEAYAEELVDAYLHSSKPDRAVEAALRFEQRRVLWESRKTTVENPLYYAVMSITMAERILRRAKRATTP